LVVLDQQRMLIPDGLPHEDGHAQERRFIPPEAGATQERALEAVRCSALLALLA
jgi:hypothetical protein